MDDIKRQSPVQFESRPVSTEVRDHWPVVLEYEGEGAGPWLVDLSHKHRWDFQDGHLDAQKPAGIDPPAMQGDCHLEDGILVNRMNRTQAAVWHLAHRDPNPPEPPAEPGYTDVSEATVLLALLGPKVFAVAEKLSALDLTDPGRRPPILLQGPFSHVPCQIVILKREQDGSGAILLTCSRGYAHDIVHAILDAGAEFGLQPAGETAFAPYLE